MSSRSDGFTSLRRLQYKRSINKHFLINFYEKVRFSLVYPICLHTFQIFANTGNIRFVLKTTVVVFKPVETVCPTNFRTVRYITVGEVKRCILYSWPGKTNWFFALFSSMTSENLDTSVEPVCITILSEFSANILNTTTQL